MTYRFEHDPESGAFYFRVRDGEYHETIPLGEPGFGAGVDVDAEGHVLGFEFLSFEEYGELVERVGGYLVVPERLETTPNGNGADEDLAPVESTIGLSPREREVLQLLAEGLSDREIAERLALSQSTVRVSLRSVMKALGVRSRAEAQTRLTARRSG
jgi:DNA-binding NarL/FixJ family response regulator